MARGDRKTAGVEFVGVVRFRAGSQCHLLYTISRGISQASTILTLSIPPGELFDQAVALVACAATPLADNICFGSCAAVGSVAMGWKQKSMQKEEDSIMHACCAPVPSCCRLPSWSPSAANERNTAGLGLKLYFAIIN